MQYFQVRGARWKYTLPVPPCLPPRKIAFPSILIVGILLYYSWFWQQWGYLNVPEFFVFGSQDWLVFCWKIIPVWQLWKSAPGSTSAADATTNLIMLKLVWNAPFNFIGSPSLGIQPMKKNSACATLHSHFRKVWRVGVYINYHVWCVESHISLLAR